MAKIKIEGEISTCSRCPHFLKDVSPKECGNPLIPAHSLIIKRNYSGYPIPDECPIYIIQNGNISIEVKDKYGGTKI